MVMLSLWWPLCFTPHTILDFSFLCNCYHCQSIFDLFYKYSISTLLNLDNQELSIPFSHSVAFVLLWMSCWFLNKLLGPWVLCVIQTPKLKKVKYFWVHQFFSNLLLRINVKMFFNRCDGPWWFWELQFSLDFQNVLSLILQHLCTCSNPV